MRSPAPERTDADRHRPDGRWGQILESMNAAPYRWRWGTVPASNPGRYSVLLVLGGGPDACGVLPELRWAVPAAEPAAPS